MKFESIVTTSKYIAHEDKVVEFGAADLPEPGTGFEDFFKALNADSAVSLEKFDAEVLKSYGRII